MNLYGSDYSLSLSMFDFGDFINSSTHLETLSSPSITFSSSSYINRLNIEDEGMNKKRESGISSKHHRHDGTSPLPLGMEWSPPPHIWDGRKSVWPHDFRTGWSYCVTVPSLTVLSNSRGTDPIVYYRVLIGIQSPQGATTTRVILRRFSEFLKLSSDLKKALPNKKLPPSPSKGLLKIKDRVLLEERRCSLEDWMSKLLADIDLSRSAPIAIFLELEAAARSYFDESDQNDTILNLSGHDVLSNQIVRQSGYDAHTSSFASNPGNNSASETSDIGTERHAIGTPSKHAEDAILNKYSRTPIETIVESGLGKNGNCTPSDETVHANGDRIIHDKLFHRTYDVIPRDKMEGNLSKSLCHFDDQADLLPERDHLNITSQREKWLSRDSPDNAESVVSSGVSSECWPENAIGINTPKLLEAAEDLTKMASLVISDAQLSRHTQIYLPTEEQHKVHRIFSTMQQRLTTVRADTEDLIARLSQEVAIRHYLKAKVKDLEGELETEKGSGRENLQNAILSERERCNQMQWDMEELRTKCVEMELKLKSEQDEKAHLELKLSSMAQKNETLQRELEVAREQLADVQKQRDELELKSKSDMKLLVNEVKSLRMFQSELKRELGKLTEDKIEVESSLQKERRQSEHLHAANSKLLHECEILRSRLEECCISFLIEEETKLTLDGVSPSEAIDALVTSDNRLGLLLAEAQLLAQDVENALEDVNNIDSSRNNTRPTDKEMRRMLAGVLADNARLRKQVNSLIRHALSTPDGAEKAE